MQTSLSTNYYHRLGGAVSLYKALHTWALQPEGFFLGVGLWYPIDDEKESCCDGLPDPLPTSPWSLYLHCISLTHVARKFCVNPVDLSYALKGTVRVEPENVYFYDKILLKEQRSCLIKG